MARKKKENLVLGTPWLNTFADLMNLLLCFFIILFALSDVNGEKFEKVSISMANSFGVFTGGGASIGEGQLISSGMSQLNELDELFSSMGKTSEGQTNPEDATNTGEQGSKGTDNIMEGKEGVNGGKNTDGVQNSDGSQGNQNSDGSGSTGNDGTQGGQDTIGTEGANGTQDGQDMTGSNGADGNQGGQDTTGNQGADGTQNGQDAAGTQGTADNIGIDEAMSRIQQEMVSVTSGMYDQVSNLSDQYNLGDYLELSIDPNYQFVQMTMKGSVLFDSGSAEIKDGAKPILTKIGELLSKFGGYSIEIVGHTDNVPMNSSTYKDNNWLSSARALNAAEYLIDVCGIDPETLKYSGRGEYEPISSNSTPEGRARNRRIEIKIYNQYSGR